MRNYTTALRPYSTLALVTAPTREEMLKDTIALRLDSTDALVAAPTPVEMCTDTIALGPHSTLALVTAQTRVETGNDMTAHRLHSPLVFFDSAISCRAAAISCRTAQCNDSAWTALDNSFFFAIANSFGICQWHGIVSTRFDAGSFKSANSCNNSQ